MARRTVLTNLERESLITIPDSSQDCSRFYLFSESDLALIRQRRNDANRLGFAVFLCLMRYPGIDTADGFSCHTPLVKWAGRQLDILPSEWESYAIREETRREHQREIRGYLNLKQFDAPSSSLLLKELISIAIQCDDGLVLAESAVEFCAKNRILLPSVATIERHCSEAATRAEETIFHLIVDPLSERQKKLMDRMLKVVVNSSRTLLTDLSSTVTKPSARKILELIDRLNRLRNYHIPQIIQRTVHQNRLQKLARETSRMVPRDLAAYEPLRRYACVTALILELREKTTDTILEFHDQIMGKIFSRSKRNYDKRIVELGLSGAESDKIRRELLKVVVESHKSGKDVGKAIESHWKWEQLEKTLEESDATKLPESHLSLAASSHGTLKKYALQLLECFTFDALPESQCIIDALTTIWLCYKTEARSLPKEPPLKMVTPKWLPLVVTADGINRQFYEICAFARLKDALRSGDIWVEGSRRHLNFDTYQLPKPVFEIMKQENRLGLSIDTNCDTFLSLQTEKVSEALYDLNRKAKLGDLEGVSFNDDRMVLSPLEPTVPVEAKDFIREVASQMRRIKITDLLQEVDEQTNFSQQFLHLKQDCPAPDRNLLLTAILADGINLGLKKMADCCPGTSYERLSWLQAWYIRDETYQAALAELMNNQLVSPIAQLWGDGTTSSSDGQWFRAGRGGKYTGHVNLKYGTGPGRTVYTHVSDQYTPFHVKLVNVGLRDSTFVLDGLLYHESDMKIEEHYTDTAGFTDHIFAMMQILGFRFCPRIRDLNETKLYLPEKGLKLPHIASMVSKKAVNQVRIHENWDEILRLSASIKSGTVTSSLILHKLSASTNQNSLAGALSEVGKLERTLFVCDWLRDPEMRKRNQRGLNKGESRHTLARAVHFHRLGEFRDRSFEQQFFRASGLTLLTSAIIHWNTIELEKVINKMRAEGKLKDESLLEYLSPLGSEHIGLTGDYIWSDAKRIT